MLDDYGGDGNFVVLVGVAILALSKEAIRFVIEAIAGKFLCLIGIHDWQGIPHREFYQYCKRCHRVDDIRKDGVENDKKGASKRRAKTDCTWYKRVD